MATVVSLTWEELLEKALQLPSDEKEQIARALYESLAAEEDEDPTEVEAAWAEEIQRRVEEIRNGTVETIPADEVFAEMGHGSDEASCPISSRCSSRIRRCNPAREGRAARTRRRFQAEVERTAGRIADAPEQGSPAPAVDPLKEKGSRVGAFRVWCRLLSASRRRRPLLPRRKGPGRR